MIPAPADTGTNPQPGTGAKNRISPKKNAGPLWGPAS